MSLSLASRRALSRQILSRPVVLQGQRMASSSTPASQQDPKQKASALLDLLPGNSVVSKTGWVTLTTALTAGAISNELFVLNEEVVILGSFVAFVGYMTTMVKQPYADWANGQIKKVGDLLNAARKEHTDAVKTRIDTAGEMKDVEQLTKDLFELSKNTAKLEHETFALKQKAALASELRSVLDAWVRHEAQVREAEQKQLVQTVLANVQKGLQDKKLQRDVLAASVQEVEQLVKSKAI